MASTPAFDPKLDLTFERRIDTPPEKVFAAWTTPELMKEWFCPLPWRVVAAEVDARAGGVFANTMQSPEGQQFPSEGCILEVVPNRLLVWTGALKRDFRPNPPAVTGTASFMFTARIEMIPDGTGTLYRATVFHADEDGAKKHAEMGFHAGWGKALDQLVALMATK